jgi:hypothetical protein
MTDLPVWLNSPIPSQARASWPYSPVSAFAARSRIRSPVELTISRLHILAIRHFPKLVLAL